MSVPIYSIYKITNTINNKVYVGFTSQNPPIIRWYQHCCRKNKLSKSLIHRAIKKYGKEKFTFEVICQCLDFNYASEYLENYFIKLYKSRNELYGYNMIAGGHNKIGEANPMFGKTRKHSYSTKQKISKGNTGKIRTEEFKLKIRQSLIGNKRALGHKHTEEARKNMGASRLGKKRGPYKKKIKPASDI